MVRLGLVIGAAEGNFEEARAAIAIQKPDLIYCVKLAGVHWTERFDWWVTLHPEWIADHVAERRVLGLPDGYRIVSAPEIRNVASFAIDRLVPYRWQPHGASASSGIFAAKVALEDCERVILAGVPMDGRKHFARGKPWKRHARFMDGWREAVPYLQGRVTSMSGLTAKVLGEPLPIRSPSTEPL